MPHLVCLGHETPSGLCFAEGTDIDNIPGHAPYFRFELFFGLCDEKCLFYFVTDSNATEMATFIYLVDKLRSDNSTTVWSTRLEG